MSAVRERVAGNEVSKRSAGEGGRLNARHKGGRLMVLLSPGCHVVPAKTIVKRHVWQDTEAVLHKQITIGGRLIEIWGRLLRVEVWRPEEEVSEAVASRLLAGTKEREGAICDQIRRLLDLVPDVTTANFERVAADGS